MFVALTGILISFFAYFIAFPHPAERRFDIYLGIFALHILATVAYWLMGFEQALDSYQYYRDSYNMLESSSFQTGTYFVIWFEQSLIYLFGGSILDHFLLFQAFGMLAIVLMIRTLQEVANSLRVPFPPSLYFLFFLPGLHFWSVAIGKDAPMLMAISICVWSMVRPTRRVLWLAIGLGLMVLIRPHVAALACIPIATTIFFTSGLSMKSRILLGPVALVAVVGTLIAAQARLGIDLNLESMTDFIETQQGYSERYGGATNFQNLSFPMKVFTLLFRPLFWDASDLRGMAASVENTILLSMFLYIGLQWRTIWMLSLRVPFLHFCTVFTPILIVLLSLVNYNLGLGQRQKMMAMPCIIVIFGSTFLYRRYLSRVTEERFNNSTTLQQHAAAL